MNLPISMMEMFFPMQVRAPWPNKREEVLGTLVQPSFPISILTHHQHRSLHKLQLLRIRFQPALRPELLRVLAKDFWIDLHYRRHHGHICARRQQMAAKRCSFGRDVSFQWETYAWVQAGGFFHYGLPVEYCQSVRERFQGEALTHRYGI
jgi:hypothetical protein